MIFLNGCGLQFETALKEIALEDRCPGWKTVRCNKPVMIQLKEV